MMKRIFTFLTLFVIAGLYISHAQVRQPVSWNHDFTGDENVALGEEIVLTFTASIDPGHWVYSATPSEGNPGAATSFEIDDQSGIEIIGEVMNEEGEPKKFYDDIFETDMVKYYDQVVFKQPIKITEASAKIEGYIRYQVCNDNLCIPGDYSFTYSPTVSNKKKN